MIKQARARFFCVTMKITLSGIILTLSFTACFPDTYNGLNDFQQRLKHADEAKLRGDYVAGRERGEVR
jgi:hypothetical protein